MKPLFDLDLVRSMFSARGFRGFWHEYATASIQAENGDAEGEEILNDHFRLAAFLEDLEKWAARADAEGASYFFEENPEENPKEGE